jgi:hypothetical protein
MEIKKALFSFATIAALSPTLALADQPSYNYVDAGYLRLDLDDISLDPTGYFVRGSIEAGENWFFKAGYGTADDSSSFVDVEADEYNVGVGYKKALGENSSFHIALDYINAEAEAKNNFGGKASADENGYGVTLGVRGMVSESFELNGGIGYADVGDEDGLGLGVGAVWYLTEGFGILAEASADDDSNRQYMVGVRLSF